MESHEIPWFQSPPSRIYFDDIGMPRLYHHKEWEIPLNIGSSPSTKLDFPTTAGAGAGTNQTG
jgi:hypothetical protein